MAVASLLDYHGNPVRRKGLIKIRANGTRSGIAETLGKALSRSPSSSLNSSVDPVVNRPGPFAGHSPSPPSSQRVHGDCDFALSSLLYLLRDRVLWPIESTSDRGGFFDLFASRLRFHDGRVSLRGIFWGKLGIFHHFGL